jgi:hypothetical protein
MTAEFFFRPIPAAARAAGEANRYRRQTGCGLALERGGTEGDDFHF